MASIGTYTPNAIIKADSKLSSKYEKRISLSLAWHWHVRIGFGAERTCGVQPTLDAKMNHEIHISNQDKHS